MQTARTVLALSVMVSIPLSMPNKAPDVEPQPVEKGPQVCRTYNVDIKTRAIALGRRSAGLTTEEQVATFLIKDFGAVEGSRLFHVEVTSHKSTPSSICRSDFCVILENDLSLNPKPLKDYDDLDATLNPRETAAGYVAFPTDAKLQTMVVRSNLADFELDLETGDFTAKRGPF